MLKLKRCKLKITFLLFFNSSVKYKSMMYRRVEVFSVSLCFFQFFVHVKIDCRYSNTV